MNIFFANNKHFLTFTSKSHLNMHCNLKSASLFSHHNCKNNLVEGCIVAKYINLYMTACGLLILRQFSDAVSTTYCTLLNEILVSNNINDGKCSHYDQF